MFPQLIVFDLAGTTVHDNRDVHRVLQYALAEHGVEVSIKDANDVMGIPKPIAIETLLLKLYRGSRRIDPTWISQIHDLFVSKMKEFYLEDPSVREIEGVSDLFAFLKSRDILVGVDTGFDRQITDPLLERMGWTRRGLIDISVTSDEVAQGRPHPDMIKKMMTSLKVSDPKRVAKVGDTPSDLLEGTSANCGWVIGVTSGAFSRIELEKEPHTHLVNDVRDTPSVVGLL